MKLKELFESAKENCTNCYYSFHEKKPVGMVYTTSNQYSLMENALNNLQTIKNSNKSLDNCWKIADKAIKNCCRCLVNGKPKSEGISDFLRKNNF